tara:strand:+ start:2620 stop:2832 length:213 start_codon:yes stop_codon:yes gene_type:complete
MSMWIKPAYLPMTTDDFVEWRSRAGLSRAAAARELGCSPKTVAAYESGQAIPRYIALAIAAIQFGLPPYR